MKILSLHWPVVIAVILGLYVLILLSLPFNTTLATIFLLAIIAYWSRLPGVGIPHPFFILYQADVIDIFMLLIAIHVSPLHAIGFAVFCNLTSRAAGVYPPWVGVFKDTLILSLNALMAPFIYILVGKNILIVVGIYSVVRIIMFVILHIIFPQWPIPQMLVSEAGAAVAVFLINMFYAKVFGSFFENLLQEGIAFNWLLFLIVTVVVLSILILVFGLSPKRLGKQTARLVFRTAKRFREKKKRSNDDEIDQIRQIRESL